VRGILWRGFLRPRSSIGARGVSLTVPVSSLALAVRDDGDFPFPMESFPPVTPLDLALFCAENICPMVGVSCEGNKEQTVALLTTIEEGHPREVKGSCSNPRGRRELLNLECSIKYDTSGASSRSGKHSRAHIFSVECFVWVSSTRVVGVCGFRI
jgi:hypothetical protein